MSGQINEVAILFADDFNSALNTADWDFNQWASGGSFYGRTQQRQALPTVSDGQLHLQLDTYNPTGYSFLGSEAITKETFSTETGGVSFEIKAHFENTVVAGIVGGMFSYNSNSGGLHDEIDFEAVSNHPDQIQTNIYANEPLGAGHPEFDPIASSLTVEHTYRIEWFDNALRWFVDGQLVRVQIDNSPQHPQALHLNIWAPASDWAEAFSAALNPVTNPSANSAYFFDINSVRVARLPEILTGTSGSDTFDGTAGVKTVLFSGNEADYTITVSSQGFSITDNNTSDGNDGSDTVINTIEKLLFNDHTLTIDATPDETLLESYRIYKAAFDRAPDFGGLGFWYHSMNAGESLTKVAEGFINSNEFRAMYGDNPTDSTFLNLLYQNVLDRTPDAAGLAFWLNDLQVETRAQVLVHFSESPENITNLIGVIANGIIYEEYPG
jgi:beta-glucanase (GH16 family)